MPAAVICINKHLTPKIIIYLSLNTSEGLHLTLNVFSNLILKVTYHHFINNNLLVMQIKPNMDGIT